MITLLTIFFIHSSSTPDTSTELEFKEEKTMCLREIRFFGNRAIPNAQLQNLVKPYLNRPFSQKDVCELQNKVVLFYRSKGYDQVEVIIPAKQSGSTLMILIK